MRMKEFIICIAIFTILYIVFFIVFDKLMEKKEKREAREHAESLIQLNQYIKFASFYGVQATAPLETLLKIYNEYDLNKDYTISEMAKVYGLNNIEYVVAFMYLEYVGVINKRIISIENDSIKKTTFVEQNMMQKYVTYFQEKKDLNTIISNMGKHAAEELEIMNKSFLMPGVRLIDSKLYYVGDYL